MKLSVKFATITLLFSILTFYLPSIIDFLSKVYEVVIFRYNNNDFLSFIFSSRDDFVTDAFRSYYKTDYILRFFTGGGSILSFQKPDNFTYDTLETDLFDIFFMFGIIFALIYLSIILFFLHKAFVYKKYTMVFIFLLVSFHSIMAGHVIFNGMSSIVVVMLMLLILNKNSDVES
jgi:hypothetical protein